MGKLALKIGICGFILAFSLPVAARTSIVITLPNGEKDILYVVRIGDLLWTTENLAKIPYHCEDGKIPPLYSQTEANDVCKCLGVGWRLPTDADWESLFLTFGGPDVAGGELRYGQYRFPEGVKWWSATDRGDDGAGVWELEKRTVGAPIVKTGWGRKSGSLYARCVRDYDVPPATVTLTVEEKPAVGGAVTTIPSRRTGIAAGKPVNITAIPVKEYSFVNWTVTKGQARFANADSAATMVTLSSDAVVRANFKHTPKLPGGHTNPNTVYSILTDPRDKRSYRTVRIGGLTWMAQDLDFATDNSKCYDGRAENCARYGRMYNWDDAMAACPAGWRLPTIADWGDLFYAVGKGAAAAGRKLKATAGWFHEGNGTDDFGFSALPGADYNSYANEWNVGIHSLWWSATEDNGSAARSTLMRWNDINVWNGSDPKDRLFAVRCVEDDPIAAAVIPDTNVSAEVTRLQISDSIPKNIPDASVKVTAGPKPQQGGQPDQAVAPRSSADAKSRQSAVLAKYWLATGSSPAAGGTVTPDRRTKFTENTPIAITAAPARGYAFVNWTVTSGNAQIINPASATTAVTMSANTKITANFELRQSDFEITRSTITDPRDKQVYETVKIDSLSWITRNVSVITDSSSCYKDDESNCEKYGRLYSWNDAVSACDGLGDGWRLSTHEDWNHLVAIAGANSAALKLKSKTGWTGLDPHTDEFGFSALPGGRRDAKGEFRGEGGEGYWWTSTGSSNERRAKYITWGYDKVRDMTYNSKTDRLAARCVRYDGSAATEHKLAILRKPASVNFTITPADRYKKYKANTPIAITATERSGYRFVNWTASGSGVKFGNADSAATTVTLSADAAITANFKLRPRLVINGIPGSGGKITPESGLYHDENTPVAVTAAPASNYSFSNWTVQNGRARFADPTSAATTVTFSEDAVIAALFLPMRELAIMRSPTVGGTVTPESELSHEANKPIAIKATPESGYVFTGWTLVSGIAQIADSTAATTTINLGDKRTTIKANFKMTPQHRQEVLARRQKQHPPLSAPAAKGPLSPITSEMSLVTSGKVVGLTVVVDFPDKKASYTQAEINDFFNRPGGVANTNSAGSVYDYFLDASSGLLEYTNIVTPIITLPEKKEFYDKKTDKDRQQARALVTHALNELSRMKFDLKDITTEVVKGRKTAVALNIIYAGNAAHKMGIGLWPHAGSYDGGITVSGTDFKRYQIMDMGNENELPQKLGTAVHENGHLLLGWPDLYAPEDAEEKEAVGRWCPMSHAGGKYPTPPNPYFRHLAGWIDTADITGARPGIEFSLGANKPKALVYKRNGQEAYFIEARMQRDGNNNWEIPGSGLAVWHIHSGGSNIDPKKPGFPMVALIQADGRNDLQDNENLGDHKDLFRSGIKAMFTAACIPRAVYHDGKLSDISLTGISKPGAVMSFKTGDPRKSTPTHEFYAQVEAFKRAEKNLEIVVDRDFLLSPLVNIPRPAKTGATLTIRSADPAKPVTLTRGARGDLFNVPAGATLILENIIVDGDSKGDFHGSGDEYHIHVDEGPLVRVSGGGTLVLSGGAVLRNNLNYQIAGAGVWVNGGAFVMNGGEISGNVSREGDAGGVSVMASPDGGIGTFTMRGGKISGNAAGYLGGGVCVRGGKFLMTGGEISGNTAKFDTGSAVTVFNSTFSIAEFTAAGGVINGAIRRPGAR